MDFAYTPALTDLRDRATRLTETIQAFELACEEGNGLPAEAHAVIADAVRAESLHAINMPAEWGGQGLTLLEQVVVQERLGRLTNALWDTVWRPANALKACTPEQRERWLLPGIQGRRRDAVAITEELAGSDPLALRTTARRDGDAWVIDGVKWFVTVGDVADYLLVLALAGEDRAPTMFLVDKDTPGVSIARTPRYMHTFVYEHPEFVFDGVRVGDDHRLGEVGQGYELTRDWFVEERLMIGARTVGAAERALQEATEWATTPGAGRHHDRQPPADPGHARRLRRRHRHQPRPGPPGGLGGRPGAPPQDAARQGGPGEAVRV